MRKGNYNLDFLKDPAARQIRDYVLEDRVDIKRDERHPLRERRNRSGREYLENFYGLRALFDYVRTLDSNLVLDIGAGTTRGISEIRDSSLGNGLEFKATVLVKKDPEINHNLGLEDTLRTSAEKLHGIDSEQCGAALSMYSAGAYSRNPGLVVKRLNKVLVPGGVFKACVFDPLSEEEFEAPREFSQQFRDAGFDLAVESASSDKNVWKILLAIKKGSEKSAKDLLNQNKLTLKQQLQNFTKDSIRHRLAKVTDSDYKRPSLPE